MVETTWTDLFSMLEDVRKHVLAGEHVVSCNDPVTRMLGMRSSENVWWISLVSVKSACPSCHREELLFEQFRTREGRQQLLQAFAVGRPRKTIWQHLKEV